VSVLISNSAIAQVAQLTQPVQISESTGAETSARTLIKRGNAEHARARYQAAIDYYLRVDASGGELHARAIYNIGVCYFELYRTEDAIRMYQRAIELSNWRYPNASYALGVALESLNRLTEAKKAFREAIANSQGKHALAYFRLGVISGDEDPESAADLFKKAIASSKEDLPGGHNNLGVMLARRGRFEEAQREFATALRQSKGQMLEAQHNLQLCRSLLKGRKDTQQLSKLIASK
jgi:tetratricopeptide (TPR) repeat protein